MSKSEKSTRDDRRDLPAASRFHVSWDDVQPVSEQDLNSSLSYEELAQKAREKFAMERSEIGSAPLSRFESDLASIIGRPTECRPFVCDGSPLDCAIFLVGFNPATSMEADFWQFWDVGHGYDKTAWLRQYLAERAAKPLKPGKKFRHAVSPTRRNIDAFVEGAGAARVLETNIYAKASEDMKSLDLASREIAPFKFLLDVIQPKVIVVHGKEAVDAIARFDLSARVIAADRHFSRGTSRESAKALGARATSTLLSLAI